MSHTVLNCDLNHAICLKTTVCTKYLDYLAQIGSFSLHPSFLIFGDLSSEVQFFRSFFQMIHTVRTCKIDVFSQQPVSTAIEIGMEVSFMGHHFSTKSA